MFDLAGMVVSVLTCSLQWAVRAATLDSLIAVAVPHAIERRTAARLEDTAVNPLLPSAKPSWSLSLQLVFVLVHFNELLEVCVFSAAL